MGKWVVLGLFVAIINLLLCGEATDWLIGSLANKFKFTKYGFTEYHLATVLSWFLAWMADKTAKGGQLAPIWHVVSSLWNTGEGFNLMLLPFQCYRWLRPKGTTAAEKDEKKVR